MARDKLVAELLDIFGDYCRNGKWHATARDERAEVYKRYESALSPAACRVVWEQCKEGDTDSAVAQDARDCRYSLECAKRIIELQKLVDERYGKINDAFGSNSQGFATFLGNLVEQYCVALAACSTFWCSKTLLIEKPPSGGAKRQDRSVRGRARTRKGDIPGPPEGMLTGFLVRAGAEIFSEGSSVVQIQPVHDREDVIIGRCLDFAVKLQDGSEGLIGRFLVPLVVISSKVYVDLTRLENVRAKAESAKRLFPRSLFLVAAQTNALAEERFCLNTTTPIPAAISPVDDMFFFRACRRQDYDGPDKKKKETLDDYMQRTSGSRMNHPMQLQPMLDYARRVRLFVSSL